MNEPYGGLGGKIGYIFGGMGTISLFYAIFFVPELDGVDELFEHFDWGWQYNRIETCGYGH